MFPDLIRCIIRIFFGYELGNDMRLQFSKAPGELLIYAANSNLIISEFGKENIRVETGGTRTTINTNIKIVPQVKIIDYNNIFSIPDELINTLSKAVPDSKPHHIDLRFGYLGRTKTDQGLFVTDGLATENNTTVYLDMPTHCSVPHEVTGYRIVHELLHCLGLEEENVTKIDWSTFIYNHAVVMPFIEKIREHLINVKQQFDNACLRIEKENCDLMRQLWMVERSLSTKGISLPEKSLVSTKSFLPTVDLSANELDILQAIIYPNLVGYIIPFA